MGKLTYQSSGVNYELMDSLKRMAQTAGKRTFKNLSGSGFTEYAESSGESASLIRLGNSTFAFVQEGLGTKNLVADYMAEIQGRTYYDSIAQDTIAMIVNDLITVGAKPISILAYWAVGNEKWFENKQRMEDLVQGWEKSCDLAGAAWVGGETPTLGGIIYPETIDLGGAAFGMVPMDQNPIVGNDLQEGDAIIFFESNGIHANGLTLARKLAEKLPQGYQTKISDGRLFGDALLDPTRIYVKVLLDLFSAHIIPHYMVNITGHGWRKLMRNKKQFTYKITYLPPVPPVLQFILNEAKLDMKEAYGNLNMGAGFALFVTPSESKKVLEIASQHHIRAYQAGHVENGKKQVIIHPHNIVFSEETLQVRI